MSFAYNNGVPAGPNDPSVDQPDMLTNTQSIENIINVDHVTFNNTAGGKHKQVTFASKNTPVAQTDPQSVLYTASGTESTVADMSFRNQNGTFPINFVRAYGTFSRVSGGDNPQNVPILSSFNVDTISQVNGFFTSYTVNLTANATTGTNVGVLVTSSGSSTATWSFAANTLSLAFSPGIGSSSIVTFMVIQL